MPERQRHEKHEVWLIISLVLDIVSDDLTASRLNSASEDERSQLSRLRELGAELADISVGRLPLVTEYELDRLQQALVGVIDAFGNWVDKRDQLQLSQHIDVAMSIVTKFPQSQLGEVRKTLNNITRTFERERTLRKELEDKLQTQTEEITLIQHNVADLDRIIKGEFETLIARSQSVIREQSQRMDNALDNFQQRIAAAEKEVMTTAKAAANKRLNSLENDSLQYVEKLSHYESQARDLLQVTGETATATDYGRHANDEKTIANKLRWSAAAFFAGSFGWVLVSAIFPTVAGSDAWVSLTVRAVGALALIGGGLYLARESATHRRQEVLARSKQLDLKAIDPFMANLPDGLRDEIKSLAARRLFADTDGDHSQLGSGHPYEQFAQAVLNFASRTSESQAESDKNKS